MHSSALQLAKPATSQGGFIRTTRIRPDVTMALHSWDSGFLEAMERAGETNCGAEFPLDLSVRIVSKC